MPYIRRFHTDDNRQYSKLSQWLTKSIISLYHTQHINRVLSLQQSITPPDNWKNIYYRPQSKSIVNSEGYLIPFKPYLS